MRRMRGLDLLTHSVSGSRRWRRRRRWGSGATLTLVALCARSARDSRSAHTADGNTTGMLLSVNSYSIRGGAKGSLKYAAFIDLLTN
jgi:hypothetical protein